MNLQLSKFSLPAKSAAINRVTILYLFIPVLLFFAGWLRLMVAVPAILILCLIIFRMIRGAEQLPIAKLTKRNIATAIAIVTVIVLIVLSSGIGTVAVQHGDNYVRNEIFEHLVSDHWPVRANIAVADSGLVYYLAFWLPSAAVGKLFGLMAGFYFQIVWAIIGVLLSYYYICVLLKKFVIWPLLVFFLFSGMAVVQAILIAYDFPGINLFNANGFRGGMPNGAFIIPPFFNQLSTVFNQSVPAWLVTVWALTQKSNRYLLVVAAVLLFSSPLPLLGLAPILIYKIVMRYKHDFARQNILSWAKEILSLENLVGGGILLVIAVIYYKSHNSVPAYFRNLAELDVGQYGAYLVAYLAIFVVLWRYHKRNVLFYMMAALVIIGPLIIVGDIRHSEFMMRAPIAVFIILFIYAIRGLEQSIALKHRFTTGLLVAVLFIGSWTTFPQIFNASAYAIRQTNEATQAAADYTYLKVLNKDSIFQSKISEDNIFADIVDQYWGSQDSFFFKYLARD